MHGDSLLNAPVAKRTTISSGKVSLTSSSMMQMAVIANAMTMRSTRSRSSSIRRCIWMADITSIIVTILSTRMNSR